MKQEDYILVETKEPICYSCIFGITAICKRPKDFLGCEQAMGDEGVKHFIYRENNETNTNN